MGYLSKTYDRYRTHQPRLEQVNTLYDKIERFINLYLSKNKPEFIMSCSYTEEFKHVKFYIKKHKVEFDTSSGSTVLKVFYIIIKQLLHHTDDNDIKDLLLKMKTNITRYYAMDNNEDILFCV